MNFCWSTLMVNNMEESLEFYQEIVGLTIARRFQARPGVEIAFLGDGETKVELICGEAEAPVQIGKDISWGFEVDSADDFMVTVQEKGVPIYSGPFTPNPHTKYFYVLDPNGLKIQFVERK